MNLQLKKFDISSIKDDRVVVFVGKRDTGKSFLCKDLLYYKRHIPVGTVISATESVNQFYSKIVPSLFIHDEYNENIIKNIITRQKTVVDKMKNEINVNGSSRIDPRAFIVFDDCLYDSSWTKSKWVRALFMNGRHFKLLFIITMQYALGVPPNLRTNIDYVFILRENIYQNRKRLYESYAGMFPSFEVYCQVMDQCTENYECLVIHNAAKSNRLDEQVFWYKAKEQPKFQMGARVFWEHHSNHYNDRYSSNNNNNNNFEDLRKKKGYIVNVEKNI